MSKLILVRGLPGSGKSTWVRTNFPGIFHLEADMFFMKNGMYFFEKSKLAQNHLTLQRIAKMILDEGADVVISNTFVHTWEITSIIYHPSVTESVVYRMTSMYGTTHGVPEETVTRMKAQMEDWPGEILI